MLLAEFRQAEGYYSTSDDNYSFENVNAITFDRDELTITSRKKGIREEEESDCTISFSLTTDLIDSLELMIPILRKTLSEK